MSPVEQVHERFALVARRFPERIAVTTSGEQLTYAELDARSSLVAHHLRGNGVRAGDLVGLCCGRGVALIVGMLGILKVNAAYLPVDPDYPKARIALLVEDSGVRVVLADDVGRACLPAGAEVLSVADLTSTVVASAPMSGSADDIAYVIYTSGSTGTPKGVQVTHRNVLRLFDSTADWFHFDEHDTWTMYHSASFDFSVWEIWGALLHGGRLTIVPSDIVANPMRMLALLSDERVTVLNQTPSAFRMLGAQARDVPDLSLRVVIFGGERLDPAMLRDWIVKHGDEQPQLVNMYGITETTVHVTYRRIVAADLHRPDRSPVGVPIPDLSVTLHDEDGQPVPDGTPGEMWVSGPGVAVGYLNRPTLTAERFVSQDGRRAYRSGDLGLYEGGELVHCGRIDDQIKVRGFRIEPFEIESALLDHPDVLGAVVASKDFGDGDVRLIACVQPAPSVPADEVDSVPDRLREHAAALLPRHLWPSDYTIVDRLPLTAQGKVDRAALLEIHDRRVAAVNG